MVHRKIDKLLKTLRVPPGKHINLRRDYDPGFTGDWLDKDEAGELLEEGVEQLAELQSKLYAQDNYAVLMVLQALDAAGKDSTIKHVMSGVNPQGVEVTSFKAPSGEELDHDFLWRSARALPRRGHIGIFNRSYYEEVLVVRVNPGFLDAQKLPPSVSTKDLWNRRFEQINNFEKYLVENGILVLKFYLNVSKEEQAARFLDRIERPEKNWKFEAGDLVTRARWDDYMDAYEDMFNHTSTEWAPWYIVPADHKWFTRLAVAAILHETLFNLNLSYPQVTEQQQAALIAAKAELEAEGAVPEEEDDDAKSAPSSRKRKRGKKSKK
jgi:PPK2 family polyphosphate:nucleotide phosphotransferase